MLQRHKYVLVGRVERATESPTGPLFHLKAIRVWKGRLKEIDLLNGSGMCGMTPTVGAVYVVFAQENPADVYMCSPIFAVAGDQGKRAVTRLDRARRYPPLSLPPEDLGRPRKQASS
jgi:hypothetical protein